jgi:tetratricopeptide (TPR) repeat protein
MKLRKHLGATLLIVCLSQVLTLSATATATATATDTQSIPPNASNNMASKDDLSAQKELFQVQLEAKKELLQKDIEAQAKRIDASEKRIDDQNNRIGDIGSNVAWFGIIAGTFGTLITLLLALGALVGYKTAKKDAQETAEGAAKETATTAAKEWFEVNHTKLISQMEGLESRIAQANQTIDGHTKEVAQKSSESQAQMKELKEALEEKAQIQMQVIQNQISQDRTTGQSEDQFPKDNSAIEQKSDQLKQKPESDYKFTDWNTRAFAAYSEGKLENTIFYWDKAISSPDIQPQAHAQTLFNKGVALGQLNRSEEAIAAYNALITLFGTAEELTLREQVAKAMNNKGVTLGKLNCREEAIATYNALITQFEAATELALREAVAKAMVNKGVTLGQLNRREEANAVYDALITQFESATELALRERVADASNGKGFNLLCRAKANWENTNLANELLATASDACKLAISKNSDNGLANGNLAYIRWLQNDTVAAEQHFKTGLASTIDGGEALHKATLKDFDIHPIEPDHGFRALVEKLWAEYQAECAET